MAMGIFEQLAWLTKRVKRLCCAIKVGALQGKPIIDMDTALTYTITEGGVYEFIGSGILQFAYPTSDGQTLIVINSGVGLLTVTGLFPADRPFEGGTLNPMPDVQAGEVYQLISINGVWRASKLYPNVI